ALAEGLRVGLGNESAQNCGGNHALGAGLEKTFRLVRRKGRAEPALFESEQMKKIILTVIQLAVTAGLLYWVYHDPTKLAEMRQAITHARWEWLVAGIFSYVVVEIAAAF